MRTRKAIVWSLVAAALPMLLAARRVVLDVRGAIEDFYPPLSRNPPAPPPGMSEASFSVGAITIRGYSAPSRNGAEVILVHGTGADSTSLFERARMLVDRGFGVFAFDGPGHGRSGGKVTWDEFERATLSAAIDHCSNEASGTPVAIGILGVSMGAYIAVQVAARDPRIRAVVLEGAFTSLGDLVVAQSSPFGQLRAIPVRIVDRALGMNFDRDQPIDIIHRISPRPLLLISGNHDDVVPPWMTDRLFENAGPPKLLWHVEAAHHVDVPVVAPSEYAVRVASFFDEALVGTHPLPPKQSP